MGRSRGRYTQTARCFRLLERLRGYREGVLIRELADEFQVHEDQIYSDLDALTLGGYSVQLDTRMAEGPSGKTRKMATAILLGESHGSIIITREERYSVLAVRRVFDVLKGSPFYRDVQAVFTKIMQEIPSGDREEYASWGERFVYVPDGGTKDYSDKGELLQALRTAVLYRRVVRYVYTQASGREQRGFLAPYAIVLYRHGLYVVGRYVKRPEDVRTPAPGEKVKPPLAAERFSEVELVSARRSFEPPRDLKLEELFQGAFGIIVGTGEPQRVVIEFGRTKRTHVLARTWHPTQKVQTLADGRVRLELVLNDLTEIVSWVLSWGPHARVLEPPALREKVVRELADAAEWYEQQRALARERAGDDGSSGC
ncbi:MAG: WYL domain-containing protein [Deltaproteobacteria bacterium]|nr:WYL domain-containing protein [Deltaproteobacteria bacterium]